MQRHQATPYQRYPPRPPATLGVPPPVGAVDQEHQVPIQRYVQSQSFYQPRPPYGSGIPPVTAYSRQLPALPTFSPQALKTFAPQQLNCAPDAHMVPIHCLKPVKSYVRVSGRTVRAPDIKSFTDKRDSKQRWIQSFTIKDDRDTIEVKIWHKTQEHLDSYSNISLDQVIHVLTDEVKLNTKPSFGSQASGMPTTSSPLYLSLTEGKLGHKIEFGNESEMAALFKKGLGANIAGIVPSISLKQILGALNSMGNERFSLVMVSSTVVNSKNGPVTKTLLTVFDTQGQEASLTLWGDSMATTAQQWDPLKTTLILTGAQVGMYAMKPQITIGYQTHVQVNPECKNVEWLKHFAARCSGLLDELNPVSDIQEVPIDHIGTCYRIADISQLAESLAVAELAYGFTYAILSEFDIESRASEILTAKW
ncbi:hypothetical protein BGZ80_004792 [Entomortierella chlamydospora]|uniref:MEIOB-like N-terminal domain-containing protein n=1 Tax=Entomortierella chlamydospora TaxID=101097 RepID=A0A9P6MLX5_9FUNG|nr:hypothetical protein BGZ80_004792 [Entomortierella chlamydospora]